MHAFGAWPRFVCLFLLLSFKDLSPLTFLFNLKHLALQTNVCPSTSPLRLTNPVCQHPGYTTLMRETFPAILWLDGEVAIEGAPGRQFYKEVRDIKELGRTSGDGCSRGVKMAKELQNSSMTTYHINSLCVLLYITYDMGYIWGG